MDSAERKPSTVNFKSSRCFASIINNSSKIEVVTVANNAVTVSYEDYDPGSPSAN